MHVVCSLCGKATEDVFCSPIKDGLVCADCRTNMSRYLGKHNPYLLSKEEYKKIILHPAQSKKYKARMNSANQSCFACGSDESLLYYDVSDGGLLCSNCKQVCITISSEYIENEKAFFASHDTAWFRKELEECYHPNNQISFNFNTQKVYLKDSLRKKNYKVVNFDDLISYRIETIKPDYAAKPVRWVYIDINYNGTVIRFSAEDSLDEKHNCRDFDQLIDCLSMIPHLNSKNQGESLAQDEGTSSVNQLRCPNCHSTNITPITETNSSGKDFYAGKGCCGFALLGPIGILCGACGKGKQVTSSTYWMCSRCGNKFQR